MQCMREQRHGKLLSKFLILLVLSVFLVSAVGCAGLGDYQIPLHSGYRICRINGSTIELYYESPDGVGSHYVTDEYFITGYWVNEDFIVLEGFSKDIWYNQEETLPQEYWTYYIVEVATSNLSGPFETKEDLQNACLELDLDISEGWLTPSSP